MRRRRVKGRFYLFLLAILLIVFLIVRPSLPFGSKDTLVMMATSEFTQSMNAVIIRDEDVFSSGTVARVEYIATEGTLINSGDTIAYLYSTGYSESELQKLETIRQNIQAYHKTILGNIVDNQLNRLDEIVNMKALEFKALVTGQTTGNMQTLARQLEAAMVNRQEYMRSNMREDLKLNKLYEDENTKLNSIASWRTEAIASRTGVISFYTDGYESSLTPEDIDGITVEDVRTVLSGGALDAQKSRTTDIYRVVDQDKWYVAILTDGKSWTPVLDQTYQLQFEGFADVAYTAKVARVQKSENELLAVFEIDDPIGPLVYQRAGRVSLSSSLTGLSVDVDALYNQSGQLGVWLYDVPGGTFVPVEVLSSDGKTAIIQPLAENALQMGQRLLIK